MNRASSVVTKPAPGISPETIRRTEAMIRPYIRRTPILEGNASEFGLDPANITFKLELLQHAGSFKPRGAFANLLLRDVPAVGVVAASGGNHGLAVAYAAKQLGVPAKIFVPAVAAAVKMEKIRSYGANLVVTGERYADALAASEEWVRKTGAMPIHAYDQLETMIGQGSLGLEFEQQAPELDTILIAVGGGGMIGGVAAYFSERIAKGELKIVGVEPEGAPTLANALKEGRPVDSPAEGIAADSLAPKRVGTLMFPIAQKFVSGVVLVSDDAIAAAQNALWNTIRVVAEPGGAAASAALLSRRYVPEPKERVGIVICGGNTTAAQFGAPAAPSR